jgi:hypothetical protein
MRYDDVYLRSGKLGTHSFPVLDRRLSFTESSEVGRHGTMPERAQLVDEKPPTVRGLGRAMHE